MRIALAGNPNSGKTTMYNALTGSSEKVGNWAGVTVDKKEHLIKKAYTGGAEIIAVDLPGAYSMSPFTSEESVTRDYVKNDKPDAIINIVDATNLSRSLFFTTQLLELGIPVVIALNKADVNEKKATKIDESALGKALDCVVIDTVSTNAEGLDKVMKAAISAVGKGQSAVYKQKDIDLSDKKAVMAEDRRRFEFVNRLVRSVETKIVRTSEKTFSDKIDRVLTNKWLGIPIFAVVMFLVFQISQAWLGTWLAEGYEFANGFTVPGLVTLIDAFKTSVENALVGGHPFLVALLTEGIIGGVSAVVGFLPLVMVMYFLIALLEDCGYMARVSVVLDPIFKKVGLSGKSVIAFVIGTGCAVPGVMACRTIRNEHERRATAMLAPFMPCGAKLPVIALLVGAFFPESAWVGTFMYFAGILVILVGAVIVNRITGNKHKKSYFIIELPEYKVPSLWNATKSMFQRGWSYIVKAGTVILLCNFVVYVMQSFDFSLTPVAEGDASSSILAAVAAPFAFLFIPLGFGVWQMAASAITGFIAKENVVGTLAVCFLIANIDGEGMAEFVAKSNLAPVAALAFLVFNLFSPPCFAAIGAMNSELKSKKWLFGGLALQIGMGYTAAFLVYQIGTLITTGNVGGGFACGLVAVLCMAAIVVALCIRGDRKALKK